MFEAEKGSAFHNFIVENSVLASEIARIADLSQKGNGSDVIKAKCDRKTALGRKPAGKTTLEDALAAFMEASDLTLLSLCIF